MESLDAFAGSYSQALARKAEEKRIPISGTFELLPNCNMHCRMCYIQHVAHEDELLPVDFWIGIYEQAIREGMLFSLVTGGEPLLYPGFFELYERISRMPSYLCINTNATLLDRGKVKELAKFPPKRINISLYGASNDTYKKLCGNPRGLEQVLSAFDLLKEFDIPFCVHGVMVPENIGDYYGIVQICDRYKVKLSMTNYMFPSFRRSGAVSIAEDRFTPQKMAETSLRYLSDHFRGDQEKLLQYISQQCEMIEKPEMHPLYNHNEVACRGGICTFWVDWRGQLAGCGVHNQNAIDLSEVSFAEAWQKTVAYTDAVRISEKCRTCPYRCICPTCPAAGFCETGAMDGTPEYLCAFCEEYAKLLMEERRRLFGED